METFKKIYKAAFYLNIVLFLFFFYSLYQYGETYSDIKTPDKTEAITSHGKTYYVSKADQHKMNIIGWTSLSLFVSVLGIGLYYKVKYKKDLL
ncbi:MAG: hypothetical protein ACTHJT_06635 [Cytophaga sp.]|uniref:hypothetical protein n=1 Tax=Cytophaga sp. TaxID=29535 RepID=UPI003F7E5E96